VVGAANRIQKQTRADVPVSLDSAGCAAWLQWENDPWTRLPDDVGCVLSTLKTALLPALLAHKFHDVGCRPARYEARDVIQVHPATSGYFVTGASLGAIRDFAGEHVMVLLLATEVEKMFG
jgi:hypothetical protein